jgi:chitodextrinase
MKKEFMTCLYLKSKEKVGVYLLATLLLSGIYPCSADTPPPASFQALYTSLDNYLVNFNATINSQWNGTTYPVLFTANLADANANAGPQMINSASVAGIQAQLQELKAMGVKGVTVEVGFPMLYEPFFSSQSQYQQFVAFYQSLAASVRALGLKLIVENEVLLNDPVTDGWNVAPFYASLNWTQYQAARAQTAVTIAQTMHPDYMVVVEEPDTEATMTGQTEAGTVAGATSNLSGILSALQAAGVSGVQLGAGVGTWLAGYQQFIQNFLALPVNFIDMHVLTVNYNYLPNALSIANLAAAAGKPVTITQSWLHKEGDSEFNVLSNDQILARNPFSFWAPLDAYFIQTMQNLAYCTHMAYMDVFESPYLFAYLPYDPSTENLSPSDIISQETQQASQNMLAASFTSTATSYYTSILPAPDTAPPSTPTSLTAGSTQPTQTYLSWNASTDNVGVAGYHVFRNGVMVATTAQAFYTDSGLADGTTYSYFVEAFDLGGNVSTPSLPANVTTWNTVPPTAPTNLVGTAVTCQEIDLTWSAATDKVAIATYRIFGGTSASNLLQVGTMYSTPTSFSNYSLTPSTKYYFGVQAVDTDGNVSPMSAIISVSTLALPSAPAKLVATAASTVGVGLTWAAGPSGMPLTGYYVFQGTKPSNLTQVATTGATSYTNGSLTPGATYYYAVQEFDKAGNVSPMSAIVSATTLALPSPPKQVVATAVSTAEISLSWTTGPSGLPIGAYHIFRGTKPSNLTQLTTIPATTFPDYQVTPATTYYYAVEEIDQNGNVSPMSAVVSATTPALPTAPKQLVATAISTTAIGLTWTAGSSGMPLTGYYVFQGTKPSNLTQVATTGATSYTAGSLTPGTTYYFAVGEFDKAGNVSPMSAVVSAATLALPSAPASVTATAVSKVEINLTWTAAHSGMPLASYRVFQGSSPSNLTQLIVLGPATTSMNVYPVTPGTTYYYGIESTDTQGNVSPMSAVAKVTTPN